MHRKGLQRPILVGGAAAEFYSTSAITTGDFDVCTTRQPEFEQALVDLGFIRPSGAGAMLKGLVHPGLKIGFEVVAEVPMDGTVDPAHVRLVEPIGETALCRVISVEDLIADRVGQYASGTAPDRLEQARRCSPFTPTRIATILIAAFGKKVRVIMPSKTLKAETDAPVIRMAELGKRVAARKAELGLPDLPRNSGKRRTASKRALLKAIEEAGGKW
jgi:hypothetical protein